MKYYWIFAVTVMLALSGTANAAQIAPGAIPGPPIGSPQYSRGGAFAGNGGIINAALISGATWAEKINNAEAALPASGANGGIVDATGMCTSGSLSTADTNVVQTVGVRIELGACTYPLGTHEWQLNGYGTQIKGISGATLSNPTTSISCTGSGTCVGGGSICSGSGVWGATIEDVSIQGNQTSGSVGMDWSCIYQSQMYNSSVGGFDNAHTFAKTSASYYDTIVNSQADGITAAYNFVSFTNSAQDRVIGGAMHSTSGTGAIIYGTHIEMDNVDCENTSPCMAIYGNSDYIIEGYAGGATILESGAQYDYILGNGSVAVQDNSGNITNFYFVWGLGGVSLPLWLAATGSLGLGNGNGAGTPTLGFFYNDGLSPIDLKFGPGTGEETTFGLHGHSPLNTGGLSATGGYSGGGLISNEYNAGNFPNGAPNSPSCSVVGSTGSATIKYAMAATMWNGQTTAVSSDTTVSNAPNTLNGTNYVQCTWGASTDDGVRYWWLVKNDNTACSPGNGCANFSYSGGQWSFNDQGSSSFQSYTAPARPSTSDVQITSHNGMFEGPLTQFNTIFSNAGTNIPTCAASYNHSRACVSDAAACTSGTAYAPGGGSVACEVWCNATNWIESGSGC